MKPFYLMLAFVCCTFFTISTAKAQDTTATITANTPPPELPEYQQPPCPVDNYLWVPGYWAYMAPNGYYWVPGVWVAAPEPNYLWTPGYWAYNDGVYGFHPGYWGLHIGFYGGVNYGYGYDGDGFIGGRWEDGHFRYNTAVVVVNTEVIHNTYADNTVIHNAAVINHASFNGKGGIDAHARPEQLAAMRENHIAATSEQMNHQQLASRDRNQFARMNRGHPVSAAMNKVGGTTVRDQPRPTTAANPGQPGADRNAIASPNGQPNANRNVATNPNGQPGANRNAAANPNAQPGANKTTAANTNRQPNANKPGAANPNAQANANNNAAKKQANVSRPANNPPAQRQVQQRAPQQPRQQPNNTAQKEPKKH